MKTLKDVLYTIGFIALIFIGPSILIGMAGLYLMAWPVAVPVGFIVMKLTGNKYISIISAIIAFILFISFIRENPNSPVVTVHLLVVIVVASASLFLAAFGQ